MTRNITKFATDILEEFNVVTKTPEDFLTSNKLSENLKKLLKKLYDFNKLDKTLAQGKGLPELIIESFGHEELWAQLELENEILYYKYLTEISKTLQNRSPPEELSEENVDENEEKSSEEEDEEENLKDEAEEDLEDSKDESEDQGSEAEEHSEEDVEEESFNEKNQDTFFNQKEMERFLDDEDRKEMKNNPKSKEQDDTSGAESDEEDIDYFEDSDSESESESKPIRYKDFFDAPPNAKFSTKTNNKFNNPENDSESDLSDTGFDTDEKDDFENTENLPESKSTFETRQERLKKKIGHLEAAALGEKPWQLKGETKAENRPQNSLLEEVLEFDVTARPNLVITEETNMLLEDVIIQRIKDKAWDSVKRKAKPVDDPLEFKKKLVLNQEKSKESLAQIYEKEYIEQRETLDADAAAQPEQESADKIACTAKIDNLFSKLDTLSHFFFTPRIVKPDVKIVSNLPAVTMEEVAPVGVSDATLLAPEEVRGKQKGELMSKEERNKTDKKRERRAKKLRQHKRRLEEEAKALDPDQPKNKKAKKQLSAKLLKQVTKDRNVSKMDESGNAPGKSSEKFFRQLEDQVKNQIQMKTVKSKKSKNDSNLNAKKLKL